ncbi:amidase [Glutamicibacter endophyticus]
MTTRSALALRNQLASGERSSREVTEEFLHKIEQLDSLGAFVYVDPERALQAADKADARYAEGNLGRLHGLPTAFKDLNEVMGMPTTYGSKAMEAQVAMADHPLVAQVRAEGAVIVGKTQVPEFGLSTYSENLVAAPSRNPLDSRLSSGGSSGGQAAAIAAGMIPVGAGSDGGGSVRIPSAACGLVGLKPSLGRVPSDVVDGYNDSFGAPKFTVSGPMAHDALDAAMFFDAMLGVDHYLPKLQGGYPHKLRNLNIGYSAQSPFDPVYPISLESAARQAFERGLKLLNERHRVEPANFNYAEDYPQTFAMVWTNSLKSLPVCDESLLGTLAREFRRRSMARPLTQGLQAATRIRQIGADFITQWSAFDVVVTPGMASAPPPIGYYTAHDADTDYRLQCQYTPYTSMVNVSSAAAISVPVSTSIDGMPMSIQLISPRGDEGLLLGLAHQLLL